MGGGMSGPDPGGEFQAGLLAGSSHVIRELTQVDCEAVAYLKGAFC